MTTINNFSWNLTDAAAYDDAFDVVPPADERSILVDEMPRDSMRMHLFLMGEAMALDELGKRTFRVFAKTQLEGARMPAYWVGSRPITVAEFRSVDDPHRYGFMFVRCVRNGTSLVCTPWSYAHSWEGWGAGTGSRRGDPVTIEGALAVRRENGVEWISFVDLADTLARVCALANHGTHGYTLLASESGNSWSLEISGTHRLWCTA
jgi:hypothetical protein